MKKIIILVVIGTGLILGAEYLKLHFHSVVYQTISRICPMQCSPNKFSGSVMVFKSAIACECVSSL